MLACDTSTVHYGHAWSTNELPHTTCKPPSYDVATSNPIAQSGHASPRYSPTVQSWARSRLPSPPLSIPSSTARPVHSEHTSSQTRRLPPEHAPAPLSPFRSVQRMKRPFQLKLPASPTRKDAKASPSSPRPMALRTWRSDQNLMATSLEAFGISPNSPRSDSYVSRSSPASPYFPPKGGPHSANENEASQACDYKHTEKPSRDSLSRKAETFAGEEHSPRDVVNAHVSRSHFVNPSESNESHSIHAEANTEEIPSVPAVPQIDEAEKRNVPKSYTDKQRKRTGTVSSDASWISNNFSYCETWLQGVPETGDSQGRNSRDGFANRRKFQIVQKSRPASEDNFAMMTPDEPVRFAVASKTKPKLVDISPKHSPEISVSSTGPSPKPVPCTPDQRQQEVSAFSPDTPSERVDSGYGTRHSYDSLVENGKDDYEYKETGSTDSDSVGSTVICPTPSLSHGSAYVPPETLVKPAATPFYKPRSSSTAVTNMSEREQLEKWWDHEWTLDQLEHSVKDFPRNMLRLTSPVIMFLRQNNEKALIRPFRNIFPAVTEKLLDCLCAALIAYNYITSISSSRRSTSFHLGIVPEKASATLGIQVLHGSPAHFKERVLGSRSVELRKHLNMIVDYLLFAICGRPDETLKSAVLVVAQILEANV